MPKQVLPIVEVPMIGRVLAHLEDHGVEEAVLSLGYLHDALEALFPNGRAGGVAVRYVVEPTPLGTAGAVGFAARSAGISERSIVVNGDILTDLDLSAMLAFHAKRSAETTISLARVDDPSAFGVVSVDGRAAQAGVPRPGSAGPPNGQVVAFVKKPVSGPDAAVGADVCGPAVVGTGASVAAGASIQGSVVGAGSSVRAGARVFDSVLLPGAVVGEGAVVSRSILGEGARVGKGAEVCGVSVIGPGYEVGAGRRLDGVRVPDSSEP